MRASLMLYLGSLAALPSLVTPAPIVRVVHISKWSSKQINAGAPFDLTPIGQANFQPKPVSDEELAALKGLINDQLKKHPVIDDESIPARPHHRHHRHRQHGLMDYFLSFFSTSPPPHHRFRHHPNENSSTVREETGAASRGRKHHRPTIVELETEGAKPTYYMIRCLRHSGREHFYQARKYADMVIVSIVLTFIGVIALIELWGPMLHR
jgi:hypothetical protein